MSLGTMANRLLMFAAEAAAPISPANGLFLLVVLFMVTLALLYPLITRRRRNQKPTESPLHTTSTPRQRSEGNLTIQRTADKALVDLVETGREISAQIDTKIRILNKLTKDADRQSRRLQKLLNITMDADEDAIALTSPAAPLKSKVTSPSGRWRSDLHTRIVSLHAAGHTTDEIAQQTRLSCADVDMVLHLLSQTE